LRLTLGCEPTDRVAPILDGRVTIEGCKLSAFPLSAEEVFSRAFANADFDVTELSASSAIVTAARGQSDYYALPIFLSRAFRHSAFYIRTDRGIRSAADLRGKIVGVPEYQMTAALWARGILLDEYGVKANEIRWRNGGLNVPGREERTRIELPGDIELSSIDSTSTLSKLLEEGALDAVITARAPQSFSSGSPNIARLFPDYRTAEESYFKKTKMFPIMHVLAVRRELADRYTWLAASIVKAFYQARKISLDAMHDFAVLPAMLPWLHGDLKRTQDAMGTQFWSYGVPDNKHVLERMFRYSFEQGLSPRLVTAEEFFAPGTLKRPSVKD
jgi:4,5-dihydroxyphthalate decarboxylase